MRGPGVRALSALFAASIFLSSLDSVAQNMPATSNSLPRLKKDGDEWRPPPDVILGDWYQPKNPDVPKGG